MLHEKLTEQIIGAAIEVHRPSRSRFVGINVSH